MSENGSYFVRQGSATFLPTSHVSGGWNTAEQHIAPPMGLLAHVIELDHAARGGNLTLVSINYDILGVIPMEAVETQVRVLRPGRTIELVEGTLSHNGRIALIARAWFLAENDTAHLQGTEFEAIPARTETPVWEPAKLWPGGFIQSLEARQTSFAPGRAHTWARTRYLLLDSEETSTTARVLGTVDLANGTTPRVDPARIIFPNVDLKVSLLRKPVSEWLGFDTRVTFEANALGLTHTVLHDDAGVIGTAVQSLTVRELPQN